jgi:hemoglobin-like flavoprotein
MVSTAHMSIGICPSSRRSIKQTYENNYEYALGGEPRGEASDSCYCDVGTMTPEQVDLIRHSFDAIWPVRRKLADLFYRRFFELAPNAKHLFPKDMERQHLKLMDMIAAIVGALDKRELFQSIIRHTGQQHAQFGVKSSHFVAFGDALIWSLEKQFGTAFTPELKDAWIDLYRNVQSEMLRVGSIV